jgi:UDP-N-acetylmuramoyl-tripeptide--D-alanyl-D-alanine ligase
MLTLREVLQAAMPMTPVPEGAERVGIGEVCIDSRQARPGSLFVAFAGERVDGHAYVGDALAGGAVAALVERPVDVDGAACLGAGRAAAELALPVVIQVEDTLAALQALAGAHRRSLPDARVVAITGSVGKTTTKEAVAAVLSAAGPTLKSEGNLNNEIGLPLTLTRLTAEHRYVVLEMGMYALGEIALLCEIAAPELGVVTNVEPVHLERLGSIERIAEAKGELVRALPADGLAVLNGDDARARGMAQWAPCPTFTYGLGKGNDFRAQDLVSLGLGGVRFAIRGPDGGSDGGAEIHSRALGRHQVMNALAAAAVARAEGIGWETIAGALGAMSPGLRLVPRRGAGGVQILDDSYNASPSATMGALEVLSELRGRRVAVLGDMLELGAAEEEGHRQVGRQAALCVDMLVTVGPRARIMAEEARKAGLMRTWSLASNAEAIDLLRGELGSGDVVLVKGSRGMAMEEIVRALEEGPC